MPVTACSCCGDCTVLVTGSGAASAYTIAFPAAVTFPGGACDANTCTPSIASASASHRRWDTGTLGEIVSPGGPDFCMGGYQGVRSISNASAKIEENQASLLVPGCLCFRVTLQFAAVGIPSVIGSFITYEKLNTATTDLPPGTYYLASISCPGITSDTTITVSP